MFSFWILVIKLEVNELYASFDSLSFSLSLAIIIEWIQLITSGDENTGASLILIIIIIIINCSNWNL